MSAQHTERDALLTDVLAWADRAQAGERGCDYLNGDDGTGDEGWKDLDVLRDRLRAALTTDHARQVDGDHSSDVRNMVATPALIEAGEDAAADRDALLAAIGFRAGPLGDGLSRKVILDDAAGLRPEMVKARRAAQDAEGSRDTWRCIAGERVEAAQSGLLLRIWTAMLEERRLRRKAEAALSTASPPRSLETAQDDDEREPAAWAVAAEKAASEAYAQHMGDPDGRDDTHAARSAAALAIEQHAEHALRHPQPSTPVADAGMVLVPEETLRDRLYEMIDGFADFLDFVPAERDRMRSRVRVYVAMIARAPDAEGGR